MAATVFSTSRCGRTTGRTASPPSALPKKWPPTAVCRRLWPPRPRRWPAFPSPTCGRRIDGLDGLRSYLRDHETETLRSLVRHFVGYALNRGVLLTDRPLIDDIVAALPQNEYRFSTVVERVVLSQQFRFRRWKHRGIHVNGTSVTMSTGISEPMAGW